MNVGSLFSGVGGLDLGLHRAGLHHVFFCESDPYRRDVLAARWPGVPIYDDVRAVRLFADADAGRVDHGELGGARRGERDHVAVGHKVTRGGVDLLCGGFPCQDLSVAGRRAGLAGDRSGLFFEFARVIDAFRPGWVLVENVPGLLSSNGGRDFGVVLGTLADLGYGVAWRVLDSRYFGVPQRRRRVFIVGALAHDDPRAAAERAGEVLAVGARCPRHPATRGETRQDAAGTLGNRTGAGSRPTDLDGHGTYVAGTLGGGAGERGWAQDTERMTFLPVARALTAPHGTGRGGSYRLDDQENIVAAPRKLRRAISSPATGVRRLTPVECERLQGFPDGWTQLGSTPDSRRYSALGDAVTVNVAEWIGHQLMQHIRREAA